VGSFQLYRISVLMGGGYFLVAKGCDDYANTHVLLAANSMIGGTLGPPAKWANSWRFALASKFSDTVRYSLTVL